MTLSNNLQSSIALTVQNLQTEASTAQHRFIVFEGLITELRYLQQQYPSSTPSILQLSPSGPTSTTTTLRAGYPTRWTALYLNAITNPAHFNVNHWLAVTAMQITKHSGLPELRDVLLIPAIIRMFTDVRSDGPGDTDSLVELAANIG